MLAPIVLFVYNRPELTLQTLRALKEAEHSQESTLYIFSDGPKEKNDPAALQKINAVREIIRQEQWCKEVIIRESEQNKGLADSVISGVTEVVSKHERVIVLEDDIIVSRGFLTYINQALDLYAKEDHVAGVSGFCYHESTTAPDVFLLPIACSWSWATWKRTWDYYNADSNTLIQRISSTKQQHQFDFGHYPFFKMLEDQAAGRVNSWAIRFYASIFLKKKFFLYPKFSLVSNVGFGAAATHTKEKIELFNKHISNQNIRVIKTSIQDSQETIKLTEAAFKKSFEKQKPAPTTMRKRLKSYISRIIPQPIDHAPMIRKLEVASSNNHEKLLLQNGKMLSNAIQNWNVEKISDAEFQVFSQWGDDGIIQYLIQKIKPTPVFIEFGVEDYKESNTRFLLHNNNWKGLIIDGSEKHIKRIKNSDEYWKFDLTAVCSFITAENINQIFTEYQFNTSIGLLSVDIDGNDYWVWKAIDVVQPEIIIVEYNSVFGSERTITIPYQPDFVRANAHHSHLYAGTSLAAIVKLSEEKGYAFVGSNSAGNNAYFVRKDRLSGLRELSTQEGYVASKFRESRDANGNLTYLSGQDRLRLIQGMPIFNTTTQTLEKI
jgi:hypothetical protein